MSHKEILWTVGITLAAMAVVNRVAFLRHAITGQA